MIEALFLLVGAVLGFLAGAWHSDKRALRILEEAKENLANAITVLNAADKAIAEAKAEIEGETQ